MSKKAVEASTKLFQVLEPLTSEERSRAVRAALTLLGEGEEQKSLPGNGSSSQGKNGHHDGDARLTPRAAGWLQTNKLNSEQLEEFFHIEDGKAALIALPGDVKGKKQQTITAYVLQGIAALIVNGDAHFTDADARYSCDHLGCLDAPNHAATTRNFGNLITGSKSAGWRLTAPGLKRAASLIAGTSTTQ